MSGFKYNVTLLAFERFFSFLAICSVKSHDMCIFKLLIAPLTLGRVQAQMKRSRVLPQFKISRVWRRAKVAGESFLLLWTFVLSHHVILQRSLLSKSLLTRGTYVGFFTSVNSFVSFHMELVCSGTLKGNDCMTKVVLLNGSACVFSSESALQILFHNQGSCVSLFVCACSFCVSSARAR